MKKILEPIKRMTYQEREDLKSFTSRGECLVEVVFMIAHWMRETSKVAFSEYAANWVAANVADDTSAMKDRWPLKGPRMIADGETGWGSFEREGQK